MPAKPDGWINYQSWIFRLKIALVSKIPVQIYYHIMVSVSRVILLLLLYIL